MCAMEINMLTREELVEILMKQEEQIKSLLNDKRKLNEEFRKHNEVYGKLVNRLSELVEKFIAG